MQRLSSRVVEFQQQNSATKNISSIIPEKSKKKKLERQLSQCEKYTQVYQFYVKLLLGSEKTQANEQLLKRMGIGFENEDFEDDFQNPEAIISFPNPDCIADDYECPLNQLEIFEQIVKSLHINLNSTRDKIFAKAIEDVFINLTDRKVCHLFELKSRGVLYQNRKTLTEQSLIQANFPVSTVPDEMVNKSYSPEFFHEEKYERMGNKFKKYLTENIIKNQLSTQNTSDFVVTNITKLIYVSKKAHSQGEYLKNQYGKWIRTKNDTADLLTLVRNSIIIKLSQKGFILRQFISKDGQTIYLKLYMSEKMLETAAEINHLRKKLTFSLTDLLSLEPVDKRFRPLRLNGRLWKNEEYETSAYFKYLRPLLIEQINQINFKKIATEVGQGNLNAQLFEYGKKDMLEDYEGPSDEEWIAYYKFLVHLNNQIKVVRERYKIENDVAYSITHNKPIEEIYYFRKYKTMGRKTDKPIFDANKFTEEDLSAIKIMKDQIYELEQEIENYKCFGWLSKIRKIKALRQLKQAHQYQNIFKEAIKVANCQSQQQLETIWDKIKQQPFEIFQPFQLNNYRKRIGQKIKNQLRWCRYIKDESNQPTLFPTHERLKLAHSTIQSTININNFKELNLLNDIFCLHDNYELFGYCNNMDRALSKESSLYKKQPFDLSADWKLIWQKPWATPTEKICSYFGEKIGLHFEYTNYFIFFATPMAALGILFSIILLPIQDPQDDVYVYITVLYSFLIIYWFTFLAEYWNQQQLTFNLKYGQQPDEKENVVRTKFKGQRIRSIETEELNAIEIKNIEYFFRQLISICVLILLLGINSGIFIGLYNLNQALKNSIGDASDDFSFEIIFTATLHNIIQIIFNQFCYEKICILLTDFENFKTAKEYEASYIIKKYTIQCFSYVFPLLIIKFLNEQLELSCAYEDCKRFVQYYYGTTTMWMLVSQAVKVLKLLFIDKVIDKKINIEEQALKQPYQKTMEMYGIQEEYLTFFVFLTLINIFGYILPFGFTMFWVWTIIYVQTEKYKLLFIYQRPWPKPEGSLGIWIHFVQLINFISLVSNSGVITKLLSVKLENELLLFFIIFILLNFTTKFVLYEIFGTAPISIEQLIKRKNYILKCIGNQIGQKKSQNNEEKEKIQKFPLFKVFGCTYQDDFGIFEELSSEDDVCHHYQHTEKQEKKKSVFKTLYRIPGYQEETQYLKTEQSSNFDLERSRISKIRNSRVSEQDAKQKENTAQIWNLKEVQQKVRSFSDVCDLGLQFLIDYFSERTINYAYQINLGNYKNSKQYQDFKTNVYGFLLHVNLLTKYNLIWTDYRIVIGHFYMRRKCLTLKNLDYIRYKIMKKSYLQCREKYKDKAWIKYRKQLQKFDNKDKSLEKQRKHLEKFGKKDGKQLQKIENILTPEEQNEYDEVEKKYLRFINKRAWLNCRKVVILRVKGFFFRGFRKSTYRKSSLKYVTEYYEAMKKLEEVQFESELHKQFNSLVQYQSLRQYNLDMFIELVNALNYEQKQTFFLSSTNKRVDQRVYHTQNLKSDFYRNVIDKIKDTYIFEQQQQKVEEFVYQYFLDEINQIPTIKTLKHLHDILWVCKLEDNQEYILQFFQIKHGQTLRFQEFHNDNLGIFLGQSRNYIKQPNILDQIDDFLIKGYCMSLYQCRNGKSLSQVIQFRNHHQIRYSQEELKKFIYANLVLMTKQRLNNISIYNYVLSNNEYMILNSISETKIDLITQLVQIVVEMILLKPIDDIKQALTDLEHPLSYFLKEILSLKLTPEQILDRMIDQDKFTEIDYQIAHIPKELTFHDYLEKMKHKMNFYLRMKQFSMCLKLISETLEYARINYFKTSEDVLHHFIKVFSTNLSSYILRSNDIKRNLDILLIYHFKICAQFGLKQQFEKEVEQLIQGLKKCVAQLKVMLRQLSLNVKLENLSEIEQCIILKRKLKENQQNQTSFTTMDRLNLLNALRQNQDYLLVIIQYQTQLSRYQNQFSAILAIQQYFNKNFLLSSIAFNEIISNQQQLVIREPIPNIFDIPLDHSLSLINIEQQSPRDDGNFFDEIVDTEDSHIVQIDQLYLTQLFFYRFLYLMNLHDNKNEQFLTQYVELEKMSLENQFLYNYYMNQVRILNNEDISSDEIQNINCEIGKYHSIILQQWSEIKKSKQIQLVQSSDQDFVWKQIMVYSDILPSFDNRQIIKQLIETQENSISLQLFQIRLIHQLLHLDNYQPISSSKEMEVKQAYEKSKFCYIRLLKLYHEKISMPKESWFFHSTLDEVQVFFYLSICFSYSSKHLENLGELNRDVIEYATFQIEKFQTQPKFYEQILKCHKINNQNVEKIQFDSNLSKNVQYRIIFSYFNIILGNKQTLKQSFLKIKEFLTDDFQSSMLVLAILHSFHVYQQQDVVELLLQFTLRLFDCGAYVFCDFHKGFEQDLQLIQCLYKKNNEFIPLPYKYFYQYDLKLGYFEDQKFNVQYLLFNILMNQDFFYIQEIIEETIEQINQNPNLVRFYHLFKSFQDMIEAINGFIERKKQFTLVFHDYKEGTLMYTLLCYLECKYYVYLIDYETAFRYSLRVLQYIKTCMKQEGQNVFTKQGNFSKEISFNKTLEILQIQDCDIIEEAQDSDYLHLFNTDFINDAILNHFLILINLGMGLPPITLLFQIQLMLENRVHIYYLQFIYASYFNFLLQKDNINLLQNQLDEDRGETLSEVNYQISLNEQKQRAYFLLKLNVLTDVTEIDQRLKMLSFQQNILQSANGELNKRLINSWALQCSSRAIDGYLTLTPSSKSFIHPYVSIMYLQQCQQYEQLGLLINSQKLIEKAEISLKEWYTDRKHPLKGLFFFYLGIHNRWLYEQYLKCVQQIFVLQEFDVIEVKVILQGLIYQDNLIYKTFDYYNQKIIKKISANLNNFVFMKLGQHERQKIFKKYTEDDIKEILDDCIQISSKKDFNGVSQFLDALAIFNHFETEHQCIDIIKNIITGDNL